jgi:hypothetical protein
MGTLNHILGAQWSTGELHLVVARNGERQIVPLRGPFHWLMGPRTCTGYWTESWQPCPENAAVGDEWQCLQCFRGRGDPRRRDDQPKCIFEPICKGVPAQCVCSFGGIKEPVEHLVYCAFYGPLPKVGMTMARRVAERLREQGADAYFVIARTPDRQSARALEKQVAFLFGLPEWRRHQEVLPQWTRPVDWNRVDAAAKDWVGRLQQRYAVEETCQHIDHQMAPLPGRPQRISAEGVHAGTWLGGRGSHVFYTPPSGPLHTGMLPVRALKRNDLVGRWFEDVGP